MVLAVTMAAAMAGCKPEVKLKSAAAPQLPEGWTMATDAETKVSVGIPPGWRQGLPRAMPSVDLGSMAGDGGYGGGEGDLGQQLQDMAAGMEAEMKEEEKAELEAMRKEKGIILHFVDGSRPTIGEEPTRYYVVKVDNPMNLALSDAVGKERERLINEDAGEAVELAPGKAWRLKTQYKNRIGDEETHIVYVFVDGKSYYALRFTSVNSPDAVLRIEKAVSETFRKG